MGWMEAGRWVAAAVHCSACDGAAGQFVGGLCERGARVESAQPCLSAVSWSGLRVIVELPALWGKLSAESKPAQLPLPRV